ncbi:hypothetical protein SAMN02745157_2517 [Kaistia soli DSM 19436]|uniref:Uncharacterized protein n=1 Tax=Kaistia soli DSM 19436 TaxID=1122133 RepID=A0A1M5CZU2_9HYPH|nr:hypothetical protein [Kaistia soli]SHF60239.1 hypothetical protein SAMN02745157_2517 [Kaistia soli DSM 19436]
MSNVIPFPQVDRLVIETGVSSRDDDPDQVGQRLFWLEYQPASGGHLIAWMGTSLAGARRAAGEWAADGVTISDRTGMP